MMTGTTPGNIEIMKIIISQIRDKAIAFPRIFVWTQMRDQAGKDVWDQAADQLVEVSDQVRNEVRFHIQFQIAGTELVLPSPS